MRIIQLSTLWTVILDFAVWFVIHMGVVWVAVRLPRSRFDPDQWLFRKRSWEREGQIYQEMFRIKAWKTLLPDGAPLVGELGFSKRNLANRNQVYLRTFLVETCRAEWTHWVVILFALPFFLWNALWVGFLMIGYALAENLPMIVAQRYNRFRFLRILDRGRAEA